MNGIFGQPGQQGAPQQPARQFGGNTFLGAWGRANGAQPKPSPFPPNFGNNTFLSAWTRMNGGQPQGPQVPMAGGNTALGAFAGGQTTRDRIAQMFLGRNIGG